MWKARVKKNVTIGSRSSQLAEIQARSVLARLADVHPDITFSLTKITTTGDRNKTTRLDRMPGLGVFVKELEEALLDGRVNIAVHSLKDLPVQIRPGLHLAAVTECIDPRDAFVSRGQKLQDLAPYSLIGTGSPRRTAQLLAYRPDLKVKSIRGNIDTRLRKVLNGEVDGIIAAAAGLLRLGLEDRITEYLPLVRFLPTPGQGVLAIETRVEDDEMLTLAQTVNHASTWQGASAERAFLQAMGGGCSTAIACLGQVSGNTLQLRGMATSRGQPVYASVEGSVLAPDEVAEQLAQRLQEMGANRTVTEATD